MYISNCNKNKEYSKKCLCNIGKGLIVIADHI